VASRATQSMRGHVQTNAVGVGWPGRYSLFTRSLSLAISIAAVPVEVLVHDATVLAIAYVASYLTAVVSVPMLVIAAGVFWIYQRLYVRKRFEASIE